MTVEIDDDVWQDVGKRFDTIARCARGNIEMPGYMNKDTCDLFYYRWLQRLFGEYKSGKITESEFKRDGESLRNGYQQHKGIVMLDFKIHIKLHEARMRSNTLFRELTEKPLQLSQKKAFCELFELISALYDDETRGKRLKESVGYYLVTDSKNLTAEEISELNEIWR